MIRKALAAAAIGVASLTASPAISQAATVGSVRPMTTPNTSHIVAPWNDTWANWQIVGSGQFIAEIQGNIWNNGPSPVLVQWDVFGPDGLRWGTKAWADPWVEMAPCGHWYWSFHPLRSFPKGTYSFWIQVLWGAELTTTSWSYEVE